MPFWPVSGWAAVVAGRDAVPVLAEADVVPVLARAEAEPDAAASPDTGQNGTEKRGLLRLGRPKAEPEPQDDVPTAKVVRQQPVRQARSKRSGKR